jgi:hypothetical protein
LRAILPPKEEKRRTCGTRSRCLGLIFIGGLAK